MYNDYNSTVIVNDHGLNWRGQKWLEQHAVCMPCVETVKRTFDYGDYVTEFTRCAMVPMEEPLKEGETLKRYKVHPKQTGATVFVEEFVQSRGIRMNTSDQYDTFLALRFTDTKKVIKASLWSDAEIMVDPTTVE
jgi:hypothetical protein